MTIRQRIAVLVILMFAAIASIGGYAIVQSRRGAAEVRSVTEGVVPSALASADLVSRLKDVQLAVVVLSSSSTPGLEQAARDRLASAQKDLQAMLDAQEKDAASASQKGLVQQARDSLNSYFEAISTTLELKAAGKSDLAQANLFGNVVQYEGELQQIIDTLRIEKTRAKDHAIAALNDNQASTARAISVLTALSVLALSVVGVLLYRRITRPIIRMQAAMSEIAAKQDYGRRVAVDSEDEIGRSIMAFNGMIARIEQSDAQLRQRSADIHAMLNHLPQGVMSIDRDLRVHPEYSVHLEQILEQRDLAGEGLERVLLRRLSLDGDTLAQLQACCRACIGEDVFNFDMNAHLLVRDAVLEMDDGRRKQLDIAWAPIVDEQGQVLRMMVCLRDVTELRELAAQSERQQRELSMIGQLLELGRARFSRLVEHAEDALVHCQVLAGASRAGARAEASSRIMRQLHTLKGNARTAGLHYLSQAVHELESLCSSATSEGPGADGQWPALQHGLQDALELLREYERIDNERLAGHAQAREADDSQRVTLDRAQLIGDLSGLREAGANFEAARRALLDLLATLSSEPLEQVLAPLTASLASLAQELGKAPPRVSLDMAGVRVSREQANVVRDAFVHLLRNALDHGMETPEQRHSAGKDEQGCIVISARLDATGLELSVEDDGRGLDLVRIREKAQDAGLPGPEDVSEQALAELIFAPGFSTASTLSMVSGRGVGLDAVRALAQEAGGDVFLQLHPARDGQVGRPFAVLLRLPPHPGAHDEAAVAPLPGLLDQQRSAPVCT